MQIFKNKVIALEEKQVRLPNGKSMRLTIVKHPKVVVIIPVIRGEFLMENHYRPVIKRWLLEFPAGFIDKGETPTQAAKRELEEETGLKATRIRYLFKNYSSAGFTNELSYFFLADAFAKGKGHSEAGEVLEIRRIGIERAVQMVKRDLISDSKTIKGILFYKEFLYQK